MSEGVSHAHSSAGRVVHGQAGVENVCFGNQTHAVKAVGSEKVAGVLNDSRLRKAWIK